MVIMVIAGHQHVTPWTERHSAPTAQGLHLLPGLRLVHNQCPSITSHSKETSISREGEREELRPGRGEVHDPKDSPCLGAKNLEGVRVDAHSGNSPLRRERNGFVVASVVEHPHQLPGWSAVHHHPVVAASSQHIARGRERHGPYLRLEVTPMI